MAKKELQIPEIEGVWSAEDVKSITDWITEGEGAKELKDQQAVAQEQSKTILEMAHVDLEKLKTPFTFNL